MTACHYTPDQIENMVMLDVIALLDYWREWPPSHEILKIVHGVEPAKKEEKAPVDSQDPSGIGGLLSQFPGGGIKF